MLRTKGTLSASQLAELSRSLPIEIVGQLRSQDAIVVRYSHPAELEIASSHPLVSSYELGGQGWYSADLRPWGYRSQPFGHAFQQVLVRGDPDVIIGIIDSGVDCGHPDFFVANFVTKCVKSYGYSPGGAGNVDPTGHGTAVASIVVARADSAGLEGAASGSWIYSYEVGRGAPECAYVAFAIEQATYDLADVINLSLGFPDTPEWRLNCQAMEQAIQFAFGAGIFVAASAGNGNGGPVEIPAAYPQVFGVSGVQCGATSLQFCSYAATWWPGSSAGSTVNLAAAAENVALSTPTYCSDIWGCTGGAVAYGNGTSYAVPHVSAAAATLIANHPDARRQNEAIGAWLEQHSYQTGLHDPLKYGAGILNVYAAVQAGSPCQTGLCSPHPDP